MSVIKKITTKALISDLAGLHNSIFVTECFGTKDLLRYELLCSELEKRGYEIDEEPRKLKISKGGVNL